LAFSQNCVYTSISGFLLTQKMKHFSFFTGLGGFDIAAEKLGIENIGHCEIDNYLRSRLEKQYPNNISIKDINDIKYTLPKAQIFTGGFPCQDASNANGKGLGTNGERTGLFRKFIEICGQNRPEYVVLENVPNLLNSGFEHVLSEIHRIGYDAEWQCISASDFGYTHKRKRLFIIAYPTGKRFKGMVLKPRKNNPICQKWRPSPLYSSFADLWNEGYEHTTALQRSDEFRDIKPLIKALGNAVMPVMAEYILKSILEYEKENLTTQQNAR